MLDKVNTNSNLIVIHKDIRIIFNNTFCKHRQKKSLKKIAVQCNLAMTNQNEAQLVEDMLPSSKVIHRNKIAPADMLMFLSLLNPDIYNL